MRDGSIPRRNLFSLLAAGVSAAHTAKAQQPRHVLYRDYSRCLPDLYRHLVGESVRMRNEAISLLTTPEAIQARQQWVRTKFWQLAGQPPAKSPLNIETTGALDRPHYRIEKLLYQTRPGLFVSANLYIPKAGKPPYPGVLFQLGHSLIGKAAAPYQKCCQGLVQLGYVVLAFDPMGQGERIYYPQPKDATRTRLSSADDEHTIPGQQLLLTGESSTLLQTWDAVRSLDVLASHPLVDPKRLASTGNSGGGTLTMMLAAVDDRLAVAAPSCPNSENFACEDFNPPGSTDDAEQNFVNGAPAGFDRWDTLYPLAPKPLLVVLSGKDFFGTYSPSYIKNGRQEYAKLASVYKALGHEDRIKWHESPLPHGFNHEARMQVYQWFRQWLQDEKKPLEAEPPLALEEERALWVTPGGSVVRDRKSLRPIDLAIQSKPATRTPVPLPELLRLDAIPPRPRRIRLATAPAEGGQIDACEVSTDTHVWVPYWHYRPAKPRNAGEVLILLDAGGRNARWGEDALAHDLMRRGLTLCVPDLRGMGDLTPEAGRGAPRYTAPHLAENHWAWAGAMLGKTLLAQRVQDLLCLVRTFQPLTVRVAAMRKMTTPALFAAAIEPAIRELLVVEPLESYEKLLGTEDYTEPFANFLPGVLRHTDLPELRQKVQQRILKAWTAEAISGA
jgi:dienelactone hydrolase